MIPFRCQTNFSKIVKRNIIIFFLLLLTVVPVLAQMPGGTPVTRSEERQTMNGREYYVHVVQSGQTVYAISKAYGVKDYDAVVKKDIHFLSVGDTVWIPVKKASVSNAEPSTQTSSVSSQNSAKNTYNSNKKTTEKKNPATSGANPAVIPQRVDASSVVVSVLIPLQLSKLSEISTTKFDVEQRGKKSYKQFEFIQFYEGIEMGLQKLQADGRNVTLNVVDIADNNPQTVEQQWASHHVEQSDFVIALLSKELFDKAAQLAQQAHVFIINPMATRSEIVVNNPYVVKCMPSMAARFSQLIRFVKEQPSHPHLYIVHSGASTEKDAVNLITSMLAEQPQVKYTLCDWSANARLVAQLKASNDAVVLCLYDRGKDRNHTFVGTLLGRLATISGSGRVTLATLDNWCDLYKDVDIGYLQNLHYLTFPMGWDYGNTVHQDFLTDFRARYGVEPTGSFSSLGYDLIRYFVSGIYAKGTDFWRAPNVVQPEGALRKYSFRQNSTSDGFECSNAALFQLVDYKLIPCRLQ